MVKIVNRKIGRLGPLWLILCVAITFTNINTLRAQLINNNNWYFGNSSQALIFTKADTFATIEENIQFTPFGQGGSAVISNEVDGNLIFYTDGFSVYDATHAVVPNGTNLNGDPSINQPAIAVPISMASNSNWYIFTNDGNDIFSTRVDFLNAPGNATAPTQPDLGDVFVADKNVATGLSNSSPAMAIFKNTTAIPAFEFWLLSHDRVTGDLRVTEVSGAGAAIGATTNVSPTAQLLVAENFSSIVVGDTARIAISPQNANANVQIWKLSLTDGVLEFDRGILNTGNADDVSPAIYDTEWSSDGSKLYISRHGSTGLTGNLYQFDFNDTLQNVNSVLPSPVFRSFGVKLGPNDTLYHLFQPTAASPIELGALSRPSDVIDSVSYDLQPFTNDNFNGRQFPEFAPPSGRFALVNFSFDGNCMNSPIRFTPEVEPSAISYFWDFNGEGTSNSHSPVFTFSTAGAKNVELTVMLEDAMETFTRSVMITDPQLMIMLPNDTTLCRGESLPLNPMPSATPLSTIWNTGETDPIINVDSVGLVDPGGTYWVSMQGPGGCSVYDEIVITIYEDTVTSSNQWYFGDMAGIDFNTNTAVTDGVSQSPEAAATFSDANGDLLMYTNGVTIYNKEHQRMVNGDNLGGDSTSAQGALIVQLPMDETIYYVFMTDPAWEDRTFDLRYAVVDLKLDSSRGAVVLKDRLLYSKSTERLAATGFGTGGNVWLISHEFGNNTFRTYPIDTAGIGQPVYSTVGTILSPAIEGHSRNYLKLVNGTQLVMTISDPDVPGDNFVELYDFDPTTGKVSNPRKINIGEPAPAEVYGVEIAGDRLWVTTRGGGGSKLIQFDIDTTNVAVIEASKFDQYAVNEELGAIETGPNGTVFIATNGLASLATIGSPTSDDGDATYNANGFDLAGRNSTFGLPNFTRPSANAGQTPQLIVGPGCRGQDIALSVTGLSQIDFIDWIFGDGQGIDSTQVSDTTHVYNVAGNYTVQARIFNRCGLNMTLSQMITIGDDIPRPTVPGVTALCDDTLILDAYANNPGLVLPTFAYTWSTGDTTQTITVNAPSTLSVFVTDRVTGCISDTVQVLVGDGRPQVDLGPPRTICQNEALGPFDAGNPGASYAWTIDGTASGSGRFQNVNTSVAGIFNYEVAVTDPITGCIGRSNLVLTINEEPQLAVSNIVAPLNCGDANATFSLDFSSSGSFSYDVISGGAGSVSIASGSITGPGSIPVAGLSAGNYSITATNDVTGCSNTISTNISDFNTGYSATLTPLPGCSTTGNASDLSDLTLDLVDNGGLPTSFNYELIDNAGMTVQSGSSTSASLPLTLSDLDSGVYNVVVTRTAPGLACVETAQVTLNELPAANIIVDPIYNFCGGQGTIPATTVPGATLTWTLPDGSTAVVNRFGNNAEWNSHCKINRAQLM